MKASCIVHIELKTANQLSLTATATATEHTSSNSPIIHSKLAQEDTKTPTNPNAKNHPNLPVSGTIQLQSYLEFIYRYE